MIIFLFSMSAAQISSYGKQVEEPMKKKAYSLLALLTALLCLLCACAAPAAEEKQTPAQEAAAPAEETAAPEQESLSYTPGTYTAVVNGHNGPITVEVTFEKDAIASVDIVSTYETTVVQPYIAEVAQRVVDAQSLAVDTVAGASIGGRALLSAVEDCVEQAGGNVEALKQPLEKAPVETTEYEADVIVIGAGGAGLASAVSANENGASVILLEKLGMAGGSTVFCGGGFNAADEEIQKLTEMTDSNRATVESNLSREPHDEFEAQLQETVRAQYQAHLDAGNTWLFDSDEFFMLQTYNGGDYRGDPELIQVLCSQALDGYHWVKALGATFQEKISMGTGALWSRTHKPSADYPKGTDVVVPFENYLNGKENAQLHFNTKAEELIVEDGKVCGVKAVCNGQEITYRAKRGVILAAGGFGANVEMRQQYNTIWPSLDASIGYSGQTVGARGEGILMAQAIGAQIVDMELIQLHPNGEPGTGKMGTPGTSGYNMIFVNSSGERFVAEDSRRDNLVNATYAQDGGFMWIVCDATKYPADNQEINNTIELGKTLKADSLEELAALMEVEPEHLKAAVEQYNATVEGAEDPFGLKNYDQKLGTPPYYAAKRVPTVHHTMGGVKIDTEAHVIGTDGNVIEGLYAAGEVTGGIHGANRLGGNAVTDIVVFGRIAGANAAQEK